MNVHFIWILSKGFVMGDDVMVTVKGNTTRQRRKVIHFVPHPEFSRDTFQNDIAVIRVRSLIQYTQMKITLSRV